LKIETIGGGFFKDVQRKPKKLEVASLFFLKRKIKVHT
jgi:hypothetical protein